MIQIILFLAWGLYQAPVEDTEWYLICKEQIENYLIVPEFCSDYQIKIEQPKNYLNIYN